MGHLREVLLFIKYSKDKERLEELLENDPGFKAVEQKAGRVIYIVTGAGLKMDENEEKVDMCKVIQDMREDAIKTAQKETQRETKRETILRMLSKKKYTYEEIAELNDVSVETVKEIERQGEPKTKGNSC